MKRIDARKIADSLEIDAWSKQFSDGDQSLAKSLVGFLEFVSRDEYAEWVAEVLGQIAKKGNFSLYSVRKLTGELWTDKGEISSRPGVSQGSEDFVYSLASNFSRRDPLRIFEHSSIEGLKKNSIREIIFIDDSIGSGERVSKYVCAFLSHPTIRSWWSFGWLKLHVVSFARMIVGEKRIMKDLPGSDHPRRMHKKSNKISFYSKMAFSPDSIAARWGGQHKRALAFFDSELRLPRLVTHGVGDVAANLVFHHSVPDNIPGVFWSDGKGFTPLFGNRTLPAWAAELLEPQIRSSDVSSSNYRVTEELNRLLGIVSIGVKKPQSVARRLNCDERHASALLQNCIDAGLISATGRLRPRGRDILRQHNAIVATYNQQLYIPQSWCAQ